MPKGTDAYRTISEVAKWLGTQSHVLRYWESKFDAIQPMKSSGGRRYYKPQDMQIIGGIRHFLHGQGMTIKALQAKIDDVGIDEIIAASPDLPGGGAEPAAAADDDVRQIEIPATEKPSNVIAFSVDPLPVKPLRPRPAPKSKQDRGQMSLFADLTESSAVPQPLNPEFTRRGIPDGARIDDAPMLNLFDEPAPDPAPAPRRAIPLSLSRKDRPNSAFAAQAGLLSAVMALPRDRRRIFAAAHGDALLSAARAAIK